MESQGLIHYANLPPLRVREDTCCSFITGILTFDITRRLEQSPGSGGGADPFPVTWPDEDFFRFRGFLFLVFSSASSDLIFLGGGLPSLSSSELEEGFGSFGIG